jgi:hypothetical protein
VKPYSGLQTSAIFPVQPVELHIDRRDRCFIWVVPKCALCGRRHIHGGGLFGDDPRQVLCHRAPHCRKTSDGYLLSDMNPARTAALLAENPGERPAGKEAHLERN